MTMLESRNIHWSAGGTPVLAGIDLSAQRGEVLRLLGPNGAGKSSLLRILAGLEAPREGEVLLEGTPLQRLPRRAAARRIAFLEQSPEVHTDISVHDAVALGRTPHRGVFSAQSSRDRDIIDRALGTTGIAHLAARSWVTLSGGERQRVQFARALAQEPQVVILDEPTNHLDIRYQLDVLRLIRQMQATVVMAIHDLTLAARFCDRVAVLHEGAVASCGKPETVITPQMTREVYEVESVVERSPHTMAPQVTFLNVARGSQP